MLLLGMLYFCCFFHGFAIFSMRLRTCFILISHHFRPRTQTHSQIQRLVKPTKKPTGTSASSSSKKPSKKIWGSVTLPLFSFDVITTDVTAHLLHGNHSKFPKHTWASVMVRNANEKSESAKASEPASATSETASEEQQPQRDSKEQPLKEPLAEVDKAQRLHCINLQMVYFRAFVFSTFKALVLHHPIHSYDVNTAIDNCEETIMEVHFTDFLLKTCNHVQQDLKSKYQEDEIENGLKMSLVKATKSCFEMDSNHVTIKKKFVEILNKTFQLVPHSNDLYYYHPGSHRQHSLGK